MIQLHVNLVQRIHNISKQYSYCCGRSWALLRDKEEVIHLIKIHEYIDLPMLFITYLIVHLLEQDLIIGTVYKVYPLEIDLI